MNNHAPQDDDTPQSAHDAPAPGKRKVLCIEDEFFIGELYERALRRAGYDVTNVLNGDDGLQVAQTNAYDLILLDLMVPGMNGIDILRTLRDTEKTPKLKAKIVITTNLDQEETMRTELEQLADGYVIKAEITPRELSVFVSTIVPAE